MLQENSGAWDNNRQDRDADNTDRGVGFNVTVNAVDANFNVVSNTDTVQYNFQRCERHITG